MPAQPPFNSFPIPGADNPNRVYLMIGADFERQRAVIYPGTSGRRLPSFWDVWVRQAVLEQTPEGRTVVVRPQNGRVYVSCPGNFELAVHLAKRAAEQVRAFPEPPLIRSGREKGERFIFEWQLRRGLVKLTKDDQGRRNRLQYRIDLIRLWESIQSLVTAIPLPKGCRLELTALDWVDLDQWDGFATIRLLVNRSISRRPGPYSSAELRKLVELRFALALEPIQPAIRSTA